MIERFVLAAICAAAGSAIAAEAQSFPVRPIRIIAPLGAGGSGDVLARLVAEPMTQQLGQQVVVDNRPGANGIIGMELVAKANPDGYTLVVVSTGNIAINPSLYGDKLPFRVEQDFAPVTLIANTAFVAHVSPQFQAKTIKELIALAKAQPKTINYASGGTGSTPHFMGVLFELLAGVQMTHVPYKSGPLGRVAVMSREADIMFDGLLPTLPLFKSGRLRPLGVTGGKRAAAAPDIPTIAEGGVPGYDAETWYAMFAPKGTPPAVIGKLSSTLQRTLQSPEMKEKLQAQGGEAIGSTPEALAKFLKVEMAKWAKVVKASGARPEQ